MRLLLLLVLLVSQAHELDSYSGKATHKPPAQTQPRHHPGQRHPPQARPQAGGLTMRHAGLRPLYSGERS
jgi:hypothetical protein